MNTETLETQIVVVGGGGAGLAAAVTAAENGVTNIILLEKRGRTGGSSALAHELFGAESQLQKQAGIHVGRDEFFKIAMEVAHWTINPRIMRAFIDKTGDTIGWLQEKGVVFEPPRGGRKFLDQQFPYNTHHIKSKKGGVELIEALTKNSEDLGIKILYKTSAKELLTDKDGKVTGVLAKTGDKEIKIMASSVVIASGGYGGNKALLRKYCPRYKEGMQHVGAASCTGDGLLMALKIGAATEDLGQFLLEAACYTPNEPVEMDGTAMEPSAVWVNKRGERFIDESARGVGVFEAAMAMPRQPDGMCYTLFDEKVMRNLTEIGSSVGWNLQPRGVPQPELPEILRSAEKKGHARIANSWDEIAEWIGAKPEVLKATIDEYNSFCDEGHDKIFVKDIKYLLPLRTPPYYAVVFYPRFLCTIGGIKVNHHMEVVDKEDNPIPGVYAAGNDVGGWEPEVYNQILTGTAFSFAVNSGRIAGEHAAKYISGKYN
jgi:fumarate reductase flavoprotein subunit